jgi:hypothetical protein
MWDLVLGWWLTFAQTGLTPARRDKLSWRTVNEYFNSMKISIQPCRQIFHFHLSCKGSQLKMA